MTNNDNNNYSARFVIPTDSEIEELMNKSQVPNTLSNTNTWVRCLENFREEANLTYKITEITDIQQLQEELILFFVGLKTKKDHQDYHPNSIKNCYNAIWRYLKDNSAIQFVNIFDPINFSRLHKVIDGKIKKIQDHGEIKINKADSLSNQEIVNILNHSTMNELTPDSITRRVYFWILLLGACKGGDPRKLQLNWIKIVADKGLVINFPRDKTNQGGLSDPTNKGRIINIPPDDGKKYTPVGDILYYISRRPPNGNCTSFFLRIQSKKNISMGIWFVDSPLGKMSHEKMICNICNSTGIDVDTRKLTNHSIRRTVVQQLTELNILNEHIMMITGHKSLAGLSAYQKVPVEKLHEIISNIIPNSSDVQEISDNEEIEEIIDSEDEKLPLKEKTNLVNKRLGTKTYLGEITSFDSKKPFRIPLKRVTEEIGPIEYNSSQPPQIMVQNCPNSKIEINISPLN
nr:14541_t:CDS:2 [Entrophospora candida]